MNREIKLKVYPSLAAALGLIILGLLLSRFTMTIWVEPATSPAITAPPTPLPQDRNEPDGDGPRSPLPLPSPAVSPLATPAAVTTPDRSGTEINPQILPSDNLDDSPFADPVSSTSVGQLRVSNQTQHPIRVALLFQTPESAATPDSNSIASGTSRSAFSSEPVHWDFAPQEGSAKGLILSLPEGNLSLRPGDVVIAFAEDGSRRYWGPYIVGQTAWPIWDQQTQEWLLTLQP